MSSGKIDVESKQKLRAADRLGRSTDVGDAVVQAFASTEVAIGDLEIPFARKPSWWNHAGGMDRGYEAPGDWYSEKDKGDAGGWYSDDDETDA